jgi:hypothetical protein
VFFNSMVSCVIHSNLAILAVINSTDCACQCIMSNLWDINDAGRQMVI